jgi:hypothetical protein
MFGHLSLWKFHVVANSQFYQKCTVDRRNSAAPGIIIKFIIRFPRIPKSYFHPTGSLLSYHNERSLSASTALDFRNYKASEMKTETIIKAQISDFEVG